MSLSIFLLSLVTIPLSLHAIPAPRGVLLNCGSTKDIVTTNLKFITDEGFISVGNSSTLKTPDLFPILSTLRYFPDKSAKKYCYVIPVIKGGKYLIRTTYYYGGFDGGNEPPVFEQIIDGTKWGIVNTTEDYAKGLTSYYEIVVAAMGKTLSVCLARNGKTVSSPFITALELENMEASVYNSTDFTKYALNVVARHSFGSNDDIVCFPDDPYNRFWQPFMDNNPIVESHSNITSSDFWNTPPLKVFKSAITTSRGKTLQLQWPTEPLPSSKYYISLYFQDNRTPSPFSWRVFSVSVNGKNFFTNLNVTTDGVMVYGTQWPLSGLTEIVMTPGADIPVGPVINAGEIFQMLPLGGRTLTRDVMGMEDLARGFNNPPSDWSGDPCLPQNNSWTGVTCTTGKLARVVTLNLTNFGLAGSLSPSIANLTGLTHLWLGGNKLSGPIPEMSTLNELQTLHLEDNGFEGSFPQSLDQVTSLQEIYVQNNNLNGTIPGTLQKRLGINLKVTPGNHLSTSA
ncbi:probable LRR receptor-like serine/threonine-protein kinase At1g67720 [Vitis riparia]|uniref:probable LRR receptor-like serine/threonine-protein kinase At1g67720 n=1 Tax=Vitis riparia TaxID=96939 RepID=UPI00155A4926|nr:probable LRR receptor-like serine/threonine-protein kinase At1g67720 [Vitis riparia]